MSGAKLADMKNDLDLMATVIDHLESRRVLATPCGALEAFRELQRLAMIYADGKQIGTDVNDPESVPGQLGPVTGYSTVDENQLTHPVSLEDSNDSDNAD